MRDTPKSAGHADCGFVVCGLCSKLQRRPVNERGSRTGTTARWGFKSIR